MATSLRWYCLGETYQPDACKDAIIDAIIAKFETQVHDRSQHRM
jgi:hypothetical protein